MICKVKIRKNQLDYFRKIARNSKYEELAYLVGRVVSECVTLVEYIEYTENYEKQTVDGVKWSDSDYFRIKSKAESKGLRIVGDIHSHPNWDAVLSPQDYQNHIEEGNRISGICSVMGRRTRVRFWIAESSLPCEIEYIDGSNKN